MLGELERWFSDTEHEFVEEFDQEDLTQELIDQNFDLKVFEERFDRKMLISEMSLCLKYKKAISDIANSEKGKHFFILEDDVIFKENPLKYILDMDEFCGSHNIKYDCVFLGEAWIRKGDDRQIFFKKEHPATNGLCTVLYTKDAITKLNNYLQTTKITQPLDWQFNDAFKHLDFNVYWGKALTRHGSVLALYGEDFKEFKSTLRDSY
jgi:GR25 family glycosyltransferase involved in LPS biosynthesis